ncbi:ABC transporter substrate-binding protein [Treponema sp. TIM-1]|uniref:ABC transporter substrate-binding protein n=1 Tax=Treponema sp. TIM-1 TaxID=2898417 RepID=UPI003980317D
MKKLLLAVTLLIFAAVLFTGCNKKEAASAAQSGAVESGRIDYSKHLTADGKTFVTVALGDDPGTFDPAAFGGIFGLDMTMYMLRECLVERVGGKLISQIAKSWTVESDNLTWHVEIFDYIYDSAGNHFTADDAVFCYERAKREGFNSTSFYSSVSKDTDYTFTIKLTDAMVGIFDQVANAIGLYTQKAYEDAGAEFGVKPVFTGAYKLTNWVQGTSLRLEKNENYWQKPELCNIYAAQNVDIIDFIIIRDAAQLAIALETGAVDMVYNLSAMEAERFAPGGSSSKGFKVWEFENLETQFMYLNQSPSSVFANDLNLRKAVMHSMDMQGLVDGVVGGRAVIAKTFGNSLIVDYQKQWDTENYFDYDLNYAKQCLAQSKYQGQTVRIMVSGNPMHGAMALILQGFLTEVGIKSEILTYDNALFNGYKYDEAQWDIMFDQTSWSGPLPTQWRDKFDARTFRGGKQGFIAVRDPKFQEMIAGADNIATYSPETVNAFHQYLKDQAYARGLFNQMSQSVSTDIVVEYMNHRAGSLFTAGCKFVWNE